MAQNSTSELSDSAYGAAPVDESDSLSLRDFMSAIRQRTRIVCALVILGVALGCLYMCVAKPLYTVTMVVGPAAAGTTKISAGSSLSSAVNSLGGGALSGILGTSGTPSTLAPMDEFMQLIISPRVAQQVIKEDPAALQAIFYQQWDSTRKEWHPPHGVLFTIERFFYWLFGMPSWTPPTAQTLSTYLTQMLVPTEVGTTAMQTLSLTFQSPKVGVDFMRQLHDVGDAMVRKEAQDLADAQINYLQTKLQTTQEIDYRQTLLGLISQQVINRMAINQNVPYAAMLVQPPIATDLPTSPNPFIILTIALVLGFLMGIFAALLAALIWPEGLQRTARTSGGRFAPAFRRALEYFLAVSKPMHTNANQAG